MYTNNAMQLDEKMMETRASRLSKAASSLVLSTRYLSGNNGRLDSLANWAVESQKARFNAGVSPATIPVTSKTRTNIEDSAIRKAIRTFREPIHVPEFCRDSVAAQEWSPEYFRQRFADVNLRVATDLFAFTEMGIPEIVDRILSGDPEKQRYVQAVSDIFLDHPEIFDDLPMANIFNIQKKGYHGAELFFGGVNTGSTWHAANEWNFFLQIYGEKQWKLLRPEYTMSMKPAFQKDLIYVTSLAYGYENPKHISTYETTLKPGDLLIVPPWWWHCVQNTTQSTIAVSIRYRTLRQFTRSPNPTLSILQLTSPHIWRNIWEENIKGGLKNDERYHHRADSLIA